jgi:RNase P subunit RPR2
MSDDSFSIRAVVNRSDTVQYVCRLLGVEHKRFTCKKCGSPCEATTAYDPRQAAFHDGETPSWYCDECDTYFRRDSAADKHTTNLYGRDR